MHLKKLVALIAISGATTSVAYAGDWYMVGSLGSSEHSSKIKSDADAGISSIATLNSSSLDKSDAAYKLQLGYQFNRNFAVEGGYVDLGKATYNASYTILGLSGTEKANIKASGWNVSAVGILPATDNFSVFGKLGLIDASMKIDVTADVSGSTASTSASASNWKTTWGLGASYNVTKNIAVRAEWEHFDKLGDKNKTGEYDVDLLSAGLVYKF